MNWSFQLYSGRNFQPWTEVLATLAGFGYAGVEGFPDVYADAAGFRSDLDRNGLAMPTGHFPIGQLEDDFGAAASIAATLGVGLIACPYIDAADRPTAADGWRAFGERLERVAIRARDAGFGFAWHNHDFEFVSLPDGSAPMTHILAAAPSIGWEMDVAWVIRAGADPLPWIERHGGRISAVHVKDIAPVGENIDEDGWADVGHGGIDWRDLLATLRQRTPAQHFIVEHDNPADLSRFAGRSVAALRAL